MSRIRQFFWGPAGPRHPRRSYLPSADVMGQGALVARGDRVRGDARDGRLWGPVRLAAEARPGPAH